MICMPEYEMKRPGSDDFLIIKCTCMHNKLLSLLKLLVYCVCEVTEDFWRHQFSKLYNDYVKVAKLH